MKNKKYLLISILLLFCVISLFTFQVRASAVTIAQNHATISAGNHLHAAHPSSTTAPSLQGEAFNVTTSGYVTGLTVRMSKFNSPTGYLTAEIWANDSGTYGTNMLLTGMPLATSTSIAMSTIQAVEALYTFSFSGSGSEYLEVGHTYVFTIKAEPGATVTGADFVGISNTLAWEGNSLTYHDSAYYVESDDLWFTLTGDTENPESPLPTQGISDDTEAGLVMSQLIDYGVPIIVMLLPVLFLWLIGGRGKWPFLMGIAIGTGIGYLFGLVPVWLVFIVSIAEVGMAYQSVRSGN